MSEVACFLILVLAGSGDTPIDQIVETGESWTRDGYVVETTELRYSEYTDSDEAVIALHAGFPDSLEGQWRVIFCYPSTVLILTEDGGREDISTLITAQGGWFSPNGRYVFLHSGGDYTGSGGLRIDTRTGEQVIYDPQPNGGWGMTWTYPHNDGSVITRRGEYVYFFDEDLDCVATLDRGEYQGVTCSDDGEIVTLTSSLNQVRAYSGNGEHLWTVDPAEEYGSTYSGGGLDISSDGSYLLLPLDDRTVLVDLSNGALLDSYFEGMVGVTARFTRDDEGFVATMQAGRPRIVGRVESVGEADEQVLTNEFEMTQFLFVPSSQSTGSRFVLLGAVNPYWVLLLDHDLRPIWTSGNRWPDRRPVYGDPTAFFVVNGSGSRIIVSNQYGFLIAEVM